MDLKNSAVSRAATFTSLYVCKKPCIVLEKSIKVLLKLTTFDGRGLFASDGGGSGRLCTICVTRTKHCWKNTTLLEEHDYHELILSYVVFKEKVQNKAHLTYQIREN